jgi:hypothetical protein
LGWGWGWDVKEEPRRASMGRPCVSANRPVIPKFIQSIQGPASAE